MLRIDDTLTPAALAPALGELWRLSGPKVLSLHHSCAPDGSSPVFTVRGRYTARGWTDWTEGFAIGSAILQFDATGEQEFLDLGRRLTGERMARHVSNIGVHDHGFNNVSTYGNLLRLMNEGRIDDDPAQRACYELALKVSGAVQAARWTALPAGGFIHSFNGPHSLFADTMRSLRSLALAHRLGHVLLGEGDRPISLLERLVQHATATAQHTVFYGRGRDIYDLRGRVAHESLFNVTDGSYRCPATQQGYSPFTTWMRALAWVMLGFAEQLEFLAGEPGEALKPFGGAEAVEAMMLSAAQAACDFYLDNTPTDGVPYWDSGAPLLAAMGDYLDRPADPFNEYEPVDSSAAVVAAQGLLRLGAHLERLGQVMVARRYRQAGLTVAAAVLGGPYLSRESHHQGLILHSVYHRPNGWDYVAPGSTVPRGESSLWGDYHARELALYLQRVAAGGPYHTFFGPAWA